MCYQSFTDNETVEYIFPMFALGYLTFIVNFLAMGSPTNEKKSDPAFDVFVEPFNMPCPFDDAFCENEIGN